MSGWGLEQRREDMTDPVTQAQDHDRRIGRLEGIAEQLTEQGRQFSARMDGLERAIADLRRETNARIDSLIRWLVGIQVASLLVMGGLLVSILLKLN